MVRWGGVHSIVEWSSDACMHCGGALAGAGPSQAPAVAGNTCLPSQHLLWCRDSIFVFQESWLLCYVLRVTLGNGSLGFMACGWSVASHGYLQPTEDRIKHG